MERLVIFNDLELRPYQYKELEERGSLTVGVRIHLSGLELEKFKNLIQQGPYYISRPGVDEKPRRVWITIDGWSTAKDGIIVFNATF
jgi:hypothetical protein